MYFKAIWGILDSFKAIYHYEAFWAIREALWGILKAFQGILCAKRHFGVQKIIGDLTLAKSVFSWNCSIILHFPCFICDKKEFSSKYYRFWIIEMSTKLMIWKLTCNTILFAAGHFHRKVTFTTTIIHYQAYF